MGFLSKYILVSLVLMSGAYLLMFSLFGEGVRADNAKILEESAKFMSVYFGSVLSGFLAVGMEKRKARNAVKVFRESTDVIWESTKADLPGEWRENSPGNREQVVQVLLSSVGRVLSLMIHVGNEGLLMDAQYWMDCMDLKKSSLDYLEWRTDDHWDALVEKADPFMKSSDS